MTAGRVTIQLLGALGEEVRYVLGYEAFRRGKSLSAAAFEIVMEAVDAESYPKDVRDRLRELGEAAKREAADGSLGRKGPHAGA